MNIDMRAVRLEIFGRTRSHGYLCLMHGGYRHPSGYGQYWDFNRCGCDAGNKKQYLSDILVTDMAKGERV